MDAKKKGYKSPRIHRTPLYRAKAAYANMLRRCGKEEGYKDVELRITKEAWLIWALPKYESFQKKRPNATPNIARKNDSGHYEIGNIELVSRKQNRKDQKNPKTWQHGTLAGYRYCKCDLCKQVKSAYMLTYKREWRAKRRKEGKKPQ